MIGEPTVPLFDRGFPKRECVMMRVAGYLHDPGKLAVPAELLEKPAKRTGDESNVIRSHTLHTYRILDQLSEPDVINARAPLHHERLEATGYPFQRKGDDLTLGSRIMAVADIFTALTEGRPYRKGKPTDEALATLEQMVERRAVDGNVVATLRRRHKEVDSRRSAAQAAASSEYEEFAARKD